MSDSSVPEKLDSKQDRDRQQRIHGIKRWVEYIKSEPPEKWGPQQNAVVNDQLEAAQSVGTSATHQEHVEDLASDIIEARDNSNRES